MKINIFKMIILLLLDNVIAIANPNNDSIVLSVTIGGTASGTVTSNITGINCGKDCNEFYNLGTKVLLTAIPNVNSVFNSWMGCVSLSDKEKCVVTMDKSKEVKAIFTNIVTSEQKQKNSDLAKIRVNAAENYLKKIMHEKEAAYEKSKEYWIKLKANRISSSGELKCRGGEVIIKAQHTDTNNTTVIYADHSNDFVKERSDECCATGSCCGDSCCPPPSCNPSNCSNGCCGDSCCDPPRCNPDNCSNGCCGDSCCDPPRCNPSNCSYGCCGDSCCPPPPCCEGGECCDGKCCPKPVDDPTPMDKPVPEQPQFPEEKIRDLLRSLN